MNPPIASIYIPDIQPTRTDVIFLNTWSLVPLAAKNVLFYRKTYKIQHDDIWKSFNILYKNCLWNVDDKEQSLKMIFDKIAEGEYITSAWTERLFNSELINEKKIRISKRKVSSESPKKNTEASKKIVNVKSILSMLELIKKNEDNFNLNYVINNQRLIVSEILIFLFTETKMLNNFKKDSDMMAWLFKHTFDKKKKAYKIYAALIFDLQMKYLKELKQVNKINKRDLTKWVPYVELFEVGEALYI